jgi:glycerophosphoryl diester phosphodiesterase
MGGFGAVVTRRTARSRPLSERVPPVLAIAHRGDPHAARENTLPAFEAAVAQRADMIELDVRRTADGGVVVVHDRTLERLWGVRRAVADTTLTETRELGVPELADVLAAVAVPVMVDYTDIDVVEPALEAIHEADALGRVLFSGENVAGHRLIRSLAPAARIALTWTKRTPCPDALLDELGVEFFNPSGNLLVAQRGLVASMHERDTKVSTWTIDRREDMTAALGIGVDGVITNHIGELVRLLDAREQEEAG